MGNVTKKFLAIAMSFVLGLSSCLVNAGDLSNDIEVIATTNQTNNTTDKTETENDQKIHELVQEEIELVDSHEKEIELTESDDFDDKHSDTDTKNSEKEETDANRELEVLKPIRVVVESEGFPEGAELDVEYPDAAEWMSLLPADEWLPAFAIRFRIKDDDELDVGRVTVRIYKDESELSGKYLYHITDKAESMSFTSNLEYTQFSGEPGLFVFTEKVVQEEKELVDTDSEDIGAYSTGQIGFDSEIDENNTEESEINTTNEENAEQENTEEENNSDDNSNMIMDHDDGQSNDTDEQDGDQEDSRKTDTWTWSNDDVRIEIYGDSSFVAETFDIRVLDEDEMKKIAVNPTAAFEIISSVQDAVSIRLSNISDQSLFFVSGDIVEEIPYIVGDEILFTSRLNGIFVFADAIRTEEESENIKEDVQDENNEEISDENIEYPVDEQNEEDYEKITDSNEESSDEEKHENETDDLDNGSEDEENPGLQNDETEDVTEKKQVIKTDETALDYTVHSNSDENSDKDAEKIEISDEIKNEDETETDDTEKKPLENEGEEDAELKEEKEKNDTDSENGRKDESKDEDDSENEIEDKTTDEDKEDNKENVDSENETDSETESEDELNLLVYEGNDYKVELDFVESIPKDSVLTVTESEHLEDRDALLQELDATNLPYARFFDMTVTDAEGNAVELPDATVSVELPDALSGENVRTIVYADGIVESSDEAGVISFAMGSLSFGVVKYYTVDFYYGENEYHLSGGGRISLDELFDRLGIEQDADDVLSATFSNQECLTVGDESNGWMLESIKPFTSEERLAVVTNELEPILITCNYREIEMVESDSDKEEAYEDGELSASGADYEVSVTYTADARIPVGSSLDVREIVDDEYESYANETMGLYDDATNLPYARFFDITILSPDGEVIEPTSGVGVSIRLMDEKPEGDNVETTAVHFAEETSGANESNTLSDDGLSEMIELVDDSTLSSVEQMDVTVNGDTVEFEAEAFSVYGVVCYYTVDFYYKDAEYHLSGGGNITLSELFEKLGIERSMSDVQNVEFTDYSLLSIAGAEDEYRITSLMPFQTSEELTVTMTDGEVIRIRMEDVTDATYAVLQSDGQLIFFRSTGTYNSSSMTDVTGNTYTGTIYSEIETMNITSYNGSPWYSQRSSIKSVQVANGQTVRPISTSYWFYQCSMLASADFTGFDTSNATNMSNMFSGCRGLTSLTLPNSFDTSNVTDMGSMFSGCRGLTSLTLPNSFDTSNVTTMNSMFYYCSSLTNLTLPDSFDTSNVTDMSSMFRDCSGLTSLTLSNSFNTSNVKFMSYMFSGCSGLTSLPLPYSFNTSNVTTMIQMFYGCRGLTSLDLSSFNTENVMYMNQMFQNCSGLTSLDIHSLNTGNVTSMQSMFEGCSKLSSVKLGEYFKFDGNGITDDSKKALLPTPFGTSYTGNWKRKEGTYVYSAENLRDNYNGSTMAGTWEWQMNGEAYAVLTQDDENYDDGTLVFFRSAETYTNDTTGNNFEDIAENTYSGRVFSGIETTNVSGPPWSSYASDIISVTTVSGQTIKPVNCDRWFYGCSDCTEINLTELNTSSITDIVYMFGACQSLTTLDLSNFNTSNVTSMAHMFNGCQSLTALDLSNFNTSNVSSMYGMFVNCSSLNTLNISSFNTRSVTEMQAMFANCSALQRIIFGINFSFEGEGNIGNERKALLPTPPTSTGKWIKTSGGHAYTPTELQSITGSTLVGTWVWESVAYAVLTDANDSHGSGSLIFFRSYENYTNDTTGNNFEDITGNTYSGRVFAGIETIDPAAYNYTLVIPWHSNRTNIRSVSVASEQIIKPVNCTYWFFDCDNCTSIDLTGFDTSNVTDMSKMFDFCENLINLTLSNSFDTSNVTDMSHMFEDCSSLTSLTLPNSFDTSNVEYMAYMFADCRNLTNLDLSHFDISKALSMCCVFYNCNSLTSLTFSNSFNTSNVTNMNSVFFNCSSLTSLDVSSFDTSKVTIMQTMFTNCSNLTTLDLSNFDTSNVTDMAGMFGDCSKLTNIDLSSFDTSKVIYDGYSAYGLNNMFYNCSNLSSVKLGSEFKFDGNNISEAQGKALLPTPTGEGYTGNWIKTTGGTAYTPTELQDVTGSNLAGTWEWQLKGQAYAVLKSNGEFIFFRSTDSYNSSSMTDVAGTTYTGTIYSDIETINPTDSDYNSVIPWYSQRSSITSVQVADGQIIRPINTSYWFLDTSLTTVDFTGFDTSDVTNMSTMFCNCSSLTSLDLSNFNTSNVTNMEGMFSKCSGLTILDISRFNTENVTKIGAMFFKCSGLTSLDLSNFNTSKVTDMYRMFYKCNGLTNLTFPRSFDTSNVMDMSDMFYNCSGLTSLDLSGFNTGNVIYMGNMFSGCENLSSVKLGEYFKFDGNGITETWAKALLPTPSGTSYTGNWKRKEGTYVYSAENLRNNYDGTTMAGTWEWELNGQAYAVRKINGELIFFRSTDSYNSSSMTDVAGTTYTGTIYNGIETINLIDSANQKWYSLQEYITSVKVAEGQIIRPINISYWFCDCNLTTVDFSGFDTSNVEKMRNTFLNCNKLTELNVSNFNTSNVTDMYCMFANCSQLTSLDLSSFDTTNVTNMLAMFNGCSGLTSLDLSSFNTANVTDMGYMFSGCENLSSVKLGEYFKFNGNGITTDSQKALLPTPSGSSYTGNWIKSGETTGALTPVVLRNTYDGSTMSGEWVWEEEIRIVNITLDDNGGTGGSGTIYSNYGDGIYLTNTEGTLSNQMTTSANPIAIPTKTGYTVTFSANGGSSTGATGDTMTSSGVFGGYYDNSSTPVQMIDSTGHITASLTPTYTEATTLTASWSNGSITLPTPTRTGYTCIGWYNGTKKGDAGDSYTPIQAETLTAGWQINTYALNVTNTTTGSMGDKTKEFSFTLALTGTDLPSTLAFTKNGTAGTATLTNDECNFTLAHNDQITFNVPYNTGYTITETSDGYTLTKTNDTGTISTSPITATFTNTMNKTIETGVENHNQLIFMLILMSLAALMITAEEKKRRKEIENSKEHAMNKK